MSLRILSYHQLVVGQCPAHNQALLPDRYRARQSLAFDGETARWKRNLNPFQPRAAGEAMAAGFKAISYQYIPSLIAGQSLKIHVSDLP
jgi:hypothetical protein